MGKNLILKSNTKFEDPRIELRLKRINELVNLFIESSDYIDLLNIKKNEF